MIDGITGLRMSDIEEIEAIDDERRAKGIWSAGAVRERGRIVAVPLTPWTRPAWMAERDELRKRLAFLEEECERLVQAQRVPWLSIAWWLALGAVVGFGLAWRLGQ